MPLSTVSFRLKRLLRLGGMVVLLSALVLALLAVAAPWIYSYWLLHPGCQGERASLADRGYESEPVSFPSRSGPNLRGWFSRGLTHPEIAIIVITGHAGNTYFTLNDASIAADAGYSTLIFEHRSCADPSLAASTGYYEAYDVLGAVNYLKTRSDVSHIGVWGYSEGGTAVLLAAPDSPLIEAVVAMGGYSSLKNDILDPDLEHGAFDQFERQMIAWTMGVQLGVQVEASSPVDVIGQISPRPVLLIYGEYEAGHGQALFQAAGDPKELWIVPGTGHGGYYETAPEEYRRRVVAFFDEAFDVTP